MRNLCENSGALNLTKNPSESLLIHRKPCQQSTLMGSKGLVFRVRCRGQGVSARGDGLRQGPSALGALGHAAALLPRLFEREADARIEGRGAAREDDAARASTSEAWAEENVVWWRVREALGRSRIKQAVGRDGFQTYLLRMAPESVQMRYTEALRKLAVERAYPKHWCELDITLAPKGREKRVLSKRRDIMPQCQGWALFERVIARAGRPSRRR